MRLPIVVALIAALVSAAGAKVLTIQTDPPGARLWHGDEYLGESPVSVEVDPGIEYRVSVVGEYTCTISLYLDDSDNEELVVLSTENAGDFEAGTFMRGVGIGFLGPILLALVIGYLFFN